jgi:hypothetical protein
VQDIDAVAGEADDGRAVPLAPEGRTAILCSLPTDFGVNGTRSRVAAHRRAQTRHHQAVKGLLYGAITAFVGAVTAEAWGLTVLHIDADFEAHVDADFEAHVDADVETYGDADVETIGRVAGIRTVRADKP